MSQQPPTTSRTDPGALAAAIVAAAIAVFMVNGVHTWLTAILGLVVVFVAHAYAGYAIRTPFQKQRDRNKGTDLLLKKPLLAYFIIFTLRSCAKLVSFLLGKMTIASPSSTM